VLCGRQGCDARRSRCGGIQRKRVGNPSHYTSRMLWPVIARVPRPALLLTPHLAMHHSYVTRYNYVLVSAGPRGGPAKAPRRHRPPQVGPPSPRPPSTRLAHTAPCTPCPAPCRLWSLGCAAALTPLVTGGSPCTSCSFRTATHGGLGGLAPHALPCAALRCPHTPAPLLRCPHTPAPLLRCPHTPASLLRCPHTPAPRLRCAALSTHGPVRATDARLLNVCGGGDGRAEEMSAEELSGLADEIRVFLTGSRPSDELSTLRERILVSLPPSIPPLLLSLPPRILVLAPRARPTSALCSGHHRQSAQSAGRSRSAWRRDPAPRPARTLLESAVAAVARSPVAVRGGVCT
jgi:hypothetical protein